MSAGIGRSMARVLLRQLESTATVYTRTAGTGPYNLVVKTGLRCSLQPVGLTAPATGPDRAEMANIAVLYWDPAYTMPEYARVVVDSRPSETYQIQAGTITPDVGPGNVTVMMHCDVVRAK